jgi:hypothetical protein
VIKKMFVVIALSALTGCWFHANKHGVGGGVGQGPASAVRTG